MGAVIMTSKLGNQTGKAANGALANTPETLELIHMIGEIDDRKKRAINVLDYGFLLDMQGKVKQYGAGLVVNGRQLFWLRDIKDKLVQAGLI